MDEMLKYIKSQGIECNPTAGYSPQSNGVAERTDWTLFEMACTILDSSGAPLELWGEAVLVACHIRNRLPSHSINDKTPHEAWTGKKLTVGHIRKWRCKVYRHINKTGRKKLDKKSMMGFLVGYEAGNIYCIYHPTTKEFKVSRDVIFSENQFIGMRDVESKAWTLELEIPDDGTENETDMGILAGEVDAGSEIREQQTPQPVLYDEIAIQSLPHCPVPPSRKPPNRRSRRLIVRAFKAMLKGNWKWLRNHREAMEAEDAKQWVLAMMKEYDSIMKNEN